MKMGQMTHLFDLLLVYTNGIHTGSSLFPEKRDTYEQGNEHHRSHFHRFLIQFTSAIHCQQLFHIAQ